jgi:hypothetical protein
MPAVFGGSATPADDREDAGLTDDDAEDLGPTTHDDTSGEMQSLPMAA